jgi:hypothetical protein
VGEVAFRTERQQVNEGGEGRREIVGSVILLHSLLLRSKPEMLWSIMLFSLDYIETKREDRESG